MIYTGIITEKGQDDMTTQSGCKRFKVIDIARFYGIGLVFYGHFIEEFMLLKNPAAAGQYKFIYSFHMVLFIILAGYVAKETTFELRFSQFVRSRFYSRLVPFFFFTFLMMVPPVFLDGKLFNLDLPSIAGYAGGLLSTIFGLPLFCVPSWFLLLIIGLELVHYLFFRFLHDADWKIPVAIISFYLIGYFLNLKLDVFNPLKGRTIGWNYFFIHEAVTLYAFYLIGLYMRRKGFFADHIPWKKAAPASLLLLAFVFFTYKLNTGPFNFNVYDAVVILFSSHGHIFFFFATALAGSMLVLFFAAMMPVAKPVEYMGQNTLILMCLNGVFYHYVNQPLAKWILSAFGGSFTVITVSGLLTTITSLLLCLPLIFLFNRYTPGMIGKKSRKPKYAGAARSGEKVICPPRPQQ